MKKHKKQILILSAVIVLALGLRIFNNRVDGRFLSDYIADKGITQITMTKEAASGDIIQEVTLDENQRQELIALFNDTTFVSRFSITMQYTDKSTYRMVGRTADGQERLELLAQGDASMFVAVIQDQQQPQALFIQNGGWKAVLEGMLAGGA